MPDARDGRSDPTFPAAPTALALSLVLALGLAGCGRHPSPAAPGGPPAPEDKVVNVYNWSDYIAPDTVEKFEKATGIHVNYDVFDANEVLEAKLLAGRSGFDIVVPSANFLQRQLGAGVYRELDKTKLTNLGNLDPKIMQTLAEYDPGNRHALPYLWGTLGIGYNVDKVRAALGDAWVPITTWRALLDPANAAKLKGCGIALLDAPTDVVDSTLIALGRDPNSEREEDLRAAEAALTAIRPYIRYFHSSQYINDLANGEICLAVGYSGDMLQARDRANEAGKGVRIAYAIPREGAQIYMDTMAIPADAPHPENALAFMNFLLRPDIAAEISNFKKFPSPNAAALPMIDDKVKADPGIYPPEAVMATLKPSLAESPEYTRLLTRAWTRIRTGR